MRAVPLRRRRCATILRGAFKLADFFPVNEGLYRIKNIPVGLDRISCDSIIHWASLTIMHSSHSLKRGNERKGTLFK